MQERRDQSQFIMKVNVRKKTNRNAVCKPCDDVDELGCILNAVDGGIIKKSMEDLQSLFRISLPTTPELDYTHKTGNAYSLNGAVWTELRAQMSRNM